MCYAMPCQSMWSTYILWVIEYHSTFVHSYRGLFYTYAYISTSQRQFSTALCRMYIVCLHISTTLATTYSNANKHTHNKVSSILIFHSRLINNEYFGCWWPDAGFYAATNASTRALLSTHTYTCLATEIRYLHSSIQPHSPTEQSSTMSAGPTCTGTFTFTLCA